jgi:hypothetical protein
MRGEASNVREYETGTRHDTKKLGLEIRQLERRYEEAMQR